MMRSDLPDERKSYFESFYAKYADPWCYDTSRYEIDKRADTLSFLRASYDRACEIGCSNGVLTEQLAPRCKVLVAVDIAEAAVAQAQSRLASYPQVEVMRRHLPHQDLDGTFDLLVLSEMLYFLSPPELAALAALAARRVVPGGDLIIVNYDGDTDTQLSGSQATQLFLDASAAAFTVVRAEQRPGYHVRLLQRRDAEN
jgi:2-polyprenyl-3-methyl-5-hydroxy-6-metoxy-1,4-benzoquinol methylase